MEEQELLPNFWIENSDYNWEELDNGLVHKCKKGEVLFREGMQMDAIYLIKKGKIKLSTINDNGDEKTVGIIGKNSMVGTSSLFNNAQYMFNATAVTDTLLLKYNKTEFISKVFNDKEMITQVLKILSGRIRILTNHVLDLSFDHSYKRLAKALLDISNTYGVKTENGNILIKLNITQRELGEIIGTTWVTVSHNLKKLTESGVIKKDKKNYIITNLDKLKNISL